ncbi:MAG TPA: phosphoenolpyruvate carboxykinase (ATP), partial [Halalkalibaculum sp.]|nr:phosphoenolpyruvate carboxykinase (ATP) [Halalkalibaculum sp.]
VNTGLTGGPYGTGKRIDLKNTRAIINAIHAGDLDNADTETDDVFKFEIPTECPNVDPDIMLPRDTWAVSDEYDKQAEKLGKLFNKNFEKYKDDSHDEIIEAGPDV